MELAEKAAVVTAVEMEAEMVTVREVARAAAREVAPPAVAVRAHSCCRLTSSSSTAMTSSPLESRVSMRHFHALSTDATNSLKEPFGNRVMSSFFVNASAACDAQTQHDGQPRLRPRWDQRGAGWRQDGGGLTFRRRKSSQRKLSMVILTTCTASSAFMSSVSSASSGSRFTRSL